MAKKPMPPVKDVLEEINSNNQKNSTDTEQPGKRWKSAWKKINQKGLSSLVLWGGTGLLTLVLVLIVIWVMGSFYIKGERVSFEEPTAQAEATATLPVQIPAYGGTYTSILGIGRDAELDTFIPDRPRFQVIQYTVQQGDTVFGIAERYNLSPSTIFWGNFNVLFDDPHSLSPGQVLNILPENGTYYEWNAGDGLNGVADFYGVDVKVIIDWPRRCGCRR